MRAVAHVAGLRIELRRLGLRETLLRSRAGEGVGDQAHAGNRRVDVYGDRVGGDGVGGGRDIGDGVGQAVCGRQRIRIVAVGVVSYATACVTVPCAGADAATRRDVDQLIVGSAVAVGTGTYRDRSALAGGGGRRQDLGGLPVGQRNACDLRLQRDLRYLGVSNTVAEAVAIVPRRVARATGDGNPGRKGQAEQTNKRQEPPHESSPRRAVEARNGLKEHVMEK